MITIIGLVAAAFYILERVLKLIAVLVFFRRRDPPPQQRPRLISVLQPIVSGDPQLPATLAQNLSLAKRWPIEFIWMTDDDDDLATQTCERLIQENGDTTIRLIQMQRGGISQSPKMIKLQRGLQESAGDVIAVLDDDTMLPDEGLDGCLGRLDDEQVGLVFGLPYYVAFESWPSSCVSCFVNSNSLLTYVPYSLVTEPFTINGMFYMMRRERLDEMQGFDGLEAILADDFAVAQHVRRHGYRLAQSRLRHAIYTHVHSWTDYFRLLRRWLVFPRETLMRSMSLSDLIVAYTFALIPCLLPLVVLACAAVAGTVQAWVAFGCCLAIHFGIFLYFNTRLLRSATPVSCFCLVPLLQLLIPLQLCVALLLPQRIVWRGLKIQVKPGGTFEILQSGRPPGDKTTPAPSTETTR